MRWAWQARYRGCPVGGERHPTAKLTEVQVVEILHFKDKTKAGSEKLAKRYKLDAQYVRAVKSAKGWTSFLNEQIVSSIEFEIGAIVGSQPFGGEGLSGTGPKAGGPNYMARFCATDRQNSSGHWDSAAEMNAPEGQPAPPRTQSLPGPTGESNQSNKASVQLR